MLLRPLAILASALCASGCVSKGTYDAAVESAHQAEAKDLSRVSALQAELATLTKRQADLQRPLRRLDEALQGRDVLLGERFSVADLNVACVIPLLRHADLGGFERAARWLARCCARDAYGRAGALA